jgi:DNA-directed RNA polymerase subunit RPC12/RpoP
MTAISYKCSNCDQENWAEDTKRGTFRDCSHCGRPVQVPGGQVSPGEAMKTCPHCAEKDLQPGAKVCKHCGKRINNDAGESLFTLAGVCLVAGFLLLPILILPGILLLCVGLVVRALG